jgi:DNA repair exonuclease SbcCD nuclease subunit
LVTVDDLSAGGTLPEPIVVEVVAVDWHPGKKRRAEVKLRDTAQNPLNLIDYEGAKISVNWEPNHRYRISRCNVTGGGRGHDVQLAPSKRTVIEPLGSTQQNTRILVVGDTHIGRKKHPKTKAEIDPLGALTAAVEYSVNQEVDAVVHAGDIFHDNATHLQTLLTRQQVFERLNEAGIPFYYVRGNHESKAGNKLLDELEGTTVFNLSTTGTTVGTDVQLFGVDHQPEGNIPWDNLTFSKTADNGESILVLHQTLQQLSGEGTKNVDLSRIQRPFDGTFDFVVSGHHHDATMTNWNGIPVMYTGAAERMSTNKDPTDRVAWLLTVTDGSISYEQYDIPQPESKGVGR